MAPFQLWDRYMRSYDFLTHVESYSQNLRDVLTAARPYPGCEILDAGSGTGNLSLALKAEGCNVVSCDFSPSAIAAHRAKDPQANVVCASLEQPLPFETDQFDAVCCASVLFALTRAGCLSALREFARVLRSEGRLVVTVAAPQQRNGSLVGLHFRGLRARYGRARAALKGLADLPALAKILYYNRQLARLPDWQGFHRFTEDELLSLLSRAGFTKIQIGRTYGDCFFLVTAQKPIAFAVNTQLAATTSRAS